MPRLLRLLLHVPLRYHVRSLFVRKTATALTVLAVGFSVATLVLVLALQRGFELSLVSGGRTDNVVFMREGATSEGESAVNREQFRLLAARQEIAIGEDGAPLATGEMYAGVSLDKVEAGSTNVSVRGTSTKALSIRSGIEIVEGRMFREGTEEVVVGKSLVGRVAGCRVGGTIDYAGRSMPVVGIIQSGGAPDSEIWGDAEVFLQVFNRESFSVVIVRLADGSGFTQLMDTLKGDPRLQLKGVTEADYFRQQAGRQGAFFQIVAYFLASIMAVGAVFGS
ncbi:MAG: ABC transporter permease, partial [Planctomycetota bacterium]